MSAAADPSGAGDPSVGLLLNWRMQKDDRGRYPTEHRMFSADSSVGMEWPPADALAPEYYHQLAELYLEAARRLPIADIPYLANCISIGGLAVGLFDPVSNIVLNTINVFANKPSVCPQPLKPDEAVEKSRNKSTYAVGVRNSRAGLIMFIMCYFRNITEDQAKKFLDMAGHDLPLAILLVEVGCWGLDVPRPQLQPDAARTKTALQKAAYNAACPMAGDLVRIMTWRYPRHLLDPVLEDLRTGNQLSAECVYKICDLLRSSCPPPPIPAPTPGTYRDTSGNITSIIEIRKNMFATTTISADLTTTTTVSSTCASTEDCTNSDDNNGIHLSTELSTELSPSFYNKVWSWRENTDFLPVLKFSLLDTIHGFYVDALGMLPTYALRQDHLLRAVLAAGHCYGPLDPVSNIILNSIWYDVNFPLSDHLSDQIGPADILDACSLARLESRSLDGLVSLICYTYSMSEQQAVVLLCEHRFNISYLLRGPPGILYNLASAARVAKHPQPAAFGDFFNSPSVATKLDVLHSIVSGLDLSFPAGNLELLRHQMADKASCVAATAVVQSRAPDLGQSALDTLSARRETFKSKQDYVRTKLEKLLLDYGRDKGHLYNLGIVCGVTTARYGFYSTCYHVNFLASMDVPNDSTTSSTLFFAEFWSIADSKVDHSTNLPFCCPVGDSFNVYSIRCAVCDHTSCKIAHPSYGHVYFTGNTEHGFPVHHEWGADLGGILESDFIYFGGESDEEFANILSEVSCSSPKKSRARELSPSSQRNTRARTGPSFIAFRPYSRMV